MKDKVRIVPSTQTECIILGFEAYLQANSHGPFASHGRRGGIQLHRRQVSVERENEGTLVRPTRGHGAD